ncbi:hypothetical protein [Candidatus Amarobacter glycogenicus]|uniref:hypothetical protein n=1 Tax=Candidatus Amarobacter glycogenicus TaxID=3140699 RepID=UPI0031CCB829
MIFIWWMTTAVPASARSSIIFALGHTAWPASPKSTDLTKSFHRVQGFIDGLQATGRHPPTP